MWSICATISSGAGLPRALARWARIPIINVQQALPHTPLHRLFLSTVRPQGVFIASTEKL